MRYVETIIVGGGPAGSSCARELLRAGRECLVLEAAAMPRVKLCAGWVTPKVLKDLQIRLEEYPHGIVTLKKMNVRLGRKRRFALKVPTLQYSIRRVEFDHWLLKRSKAEVIRHHVKSISREGGNFRIDEQFECRNLVGAGGSGCPVRKTFFKNFPGDRVLTKEVEYSQTGARPGCTLWVPYAGKGYAWQISKADAVNVGYGCTASSTEPEALNKLWSEFNEILLREGYLPEASPKPSGWFYHLRANAKEVQIKQEHAYVIGDAAGLATADMGEGIGPAVESGILAARDILGEDRYTLPKITRYSLPGLLRLPELCTRPVNWLLSALI
jgi:Dehydrogenases (flavoproteins)